MFVWVVEQESMSGRFRRTRLRFSPITHSCQRTRTPVTLGPIGHQSRPRASGLELKTLGSQNSPDPLAPLTTRS
jgi:hypothetical protein